MIAAYRLKGLGWFASCVAIVLGFYLVSLQVAAERKKLDTVNRRIAGAERDIRALETEFDTRANLAQLERWNGDTLALAAPTAGQYVADEAQLAAMDVNAPGAPGLQAVALVVPSAPGALPEPPASLAPSAAPIASQQASVTPPARVAAPVQVAALPSVVVRPAAAGASAARPAAPRVKPLRALEPAPSRATPALARVESRARASAAVAKVRPQAVAMLDRKLLSDTTLGDILSGARAEAGRRQ